MRLVTLLSRLLFLITLLMSASTSKLSAQEDANTLVPVVIASRDLPRGFQFTEAALNASDPPVSIGYWYAEYRPDQAVIDIADLRGFIARSDIPQGTPILLTQLVDDYRRLSAIGSDVALELDEESMAVPIRWNSIVNAPRDLEKYDYVDVSATFNWGDGQVTTCVLHQALQVIANNGEILTLKVDLLQDAASLVWLQDVGVPLTLTRRSSDNLQYQPVDCLSTSTLP